MHCGSEGGCKLKIDRIKNGTPESICRIDGRSVYGITECGAFEKKDTQPENQQKGKT
jgi:hypothetical protein